jgi:hypothetical protein
MVVFSGDTVRRDAEGFCTSMGRPRQDGSNDRGYQVANPTEVEACVAASGFNCGDCWRWGGRGALGRSIVVAALPSATASGDVAANTAAAAGLGPGCGYDVAGGLGANAAAQPQRQTRSTAVEGRTQMLITGELFEVGGLAPEGGLAARRWAGRTPRFYADR